MITIRQARDGDVAGIVDIYRATYGEDYPLPEYFDEYEIRKMIYSDEVLMLVAEEPDGERVVGTASVVLEVGAYTDLVGEFGRLAVHPDWRRRGIGTRLLEARIRTVEDRLHVGLIEARVTHPFTQAIALGQGFAVVGFLPLKWMFGGQRESMALLVRLFGRALDLRRNNPRVVPEVYPIAYSAMEHCGLDPDLIVDEESSPYPFGHGFGVAELTTEGYSRLMRIERGRVRNREIFGPMRLHYGYFQLMSHHSKYLVARAGPHIVGAVGFTLERLDRMVRVFELISLRDDAIRFLLDELGRRCRDEWEIDYMEIDVSAHAPRMQRTVMQLGFVPVAYAPALAFVDVERLDLVKFVRLHVPVDVSGVMLIPPVSDLARLVLRGFERKEVMPRLGEAVDRACVFQGLEAEQRERLAAEFGFANFEAGTAIFQQEEPSGEMYVILSGEVEVWMDDSLEALGTVGPGECLGEIAVLTGEPHSATAVALTRVEAAVLSRERLHALVRLRPGIGVVLYQNVARGLGEKLRRADRRAMGGAGLS